VVKRMDPSAQAVLELAMAAARAAGMPPPAPDDRLNALALDIARLGRGQESPPSEVLRFLASHHGVVEADPVIYTLSGPDHEESALVHFREAIPRVFKRAAWNRIGVAVLRSKGPPRGARGPAVAATASDAPTAATATGERRTRAPKAPAQPKARAPTPGPLGRRITVMLLWEQHLELEPVPRQLPSDGKALLRGRFVRPSTKPQVVITMPGGFVRRVALSVRGEAFESEIRCNYGDGRYQVEMMASDANGPMVLANFPVYCGVQPPTDIAAHEDDDPAEIDPAVAEQEIFALVNNERRTAGLFPLIWDDRLGAIARAHSRDMAANNFIAHVSPTTGDAVQRTRRVGLRFGLILENVGQEGGVRQAHQGFMNSPGHRANVLNAKITHVGVGVVVNRGRGAPLVVTEMFAGQ
jgi:uncharacterized protein YkwD